MSQVVRFVGLATAHGVVMGGTVSVAGDFVYAHFTGVFVSDTITMRAAVIPVVVMGCGRRVRLSRRDMVSFLSAVSCCCSLVREVVTEDRAVEVVVESVSVWTKGGGFVELGGVDGFEFTPLAQVF